MRKLCLGERIVAHLPHSLLNAIAKQKCRLRGEASDAQARVLRCRSDAGEIYPCRNVGETHVKKRIVVRAMLKITT